MPRSREGQRLLARQAHFRVGASTRSDGSSAGTTASRRTDRRSRPGSVRHSRGVFHPRDVDELRAMSGRVSAVAIGARSASSAPA